MGWLKLIRDIVLAIVPFIPKPTRDPAPSYETESANRAAAAAGAAAGKAAYKAGKSVGPRGG